MCVYTSAQNLYAHDHNIELYRNFPVQNVNKIPTINLFVTQYQPAEHFSSKSAQMHFTRGNFGVKNQL